MTHNWHVLQNVVIHFTATNTLPHVLLNHVRTNLSTAYTLLYSYNLMQHIESNNGKATEPDVVKSEVVWLRMLSPLPVFSSISLYILILLMW